MDSRINYYYRKPVEYLQNTYKKYQQHVEKRAADCSAKKQQIDTLYNDLQSALQLYEAAVVSRRWVEKQEEAFENGGVVGVSNLVASVTSVTSVTPGPTTPADLDVSQEVSSEKSVRALERELNARLRLRQWYLPLLNSVLQSHFPPGTDLSEAYERIKTNVRLDSNSQMESKLKSLKSIHKLLEEQLKSLQKLMSSRNMELLVSEIWEKHKYKDVDTARDDIEKQVLTPKQIDTIRTFLTFQ